MPPRLLVAHPASAAERAMAQAAEKNLFIPVPLGLAAASYRV
jgi:hypothetical protein